MHNLSKPKSKYTHRIIKTIATEVYTPTLISSNLLENFTSFIPTVDIIIESKNTDIDNAENWRDKVIIVNRVTVIKNELLEFKKTESIIAKYGIGSAKTYQFAGNNTDIKAINKLKKATMDKWRLFKSFDS